MSYYQATVKIEAESKDYTENYLVEAESVTEVEAKMAEYYSKSSIGYPYQVTNVVKKNYIDVI